MQKPLPVLPPSPGPLRFSERVRAGVSLTTLTVDAQTHLHRFITQALAESESPGDGGSFKRCEDWATALENALQELGEAISSGGWLAGLRRARTNRSRRSVEATQREDDAKQTTRTEAPGNGSKEHSVKGLAEPPSNLTSPEDSRLEALRYLQELASKPAQPTPRPASKLALLTVSPFNTSSPTFSEDSGFHILRPNIGCTFRPGVYDFPDSGGVVLFGLDECNARKYATEENVQLVGGTFSFQGVAASQYARLIRVLRLSVYTYLSIILEQHLLANSSAPLRFPQPSRLAALPSPVSVPMHRALSVSSAGGKAKELGSGLLAFLSRKKDSMLQSVSPAIIRRGSLELPLALRGPQKSLPAEPDGSRPRRLSLLSTPRSTLKEQPKERDTPEYIFVPVLSRLEQYRDLLSTSPGVVLPPPNFLLRLAEREEREPGRRLTGDERTALTNILGWEGKTDQGRNLASIQGFIRQQGFSVLYSEHVPPTLSTSSKLDAQPSQQQNTSSPSKGVLPKPTHCGSRVNWIFYRYYSKASGEDECLGDVVHRACCEAEELCQEAGCHFKRGEHELRWIHGGVRIVANITSSPEGNENPAQELPDMWESCALCEARTQKEQMLHGTYLFSFAKYLELLVYSPFMSTLTTPPCEHTTCPPKPWLPDDAQFPPMRFNIIRNFSLNGKTISFTLSAINDIFEIRVPRLQIIKNRLPEKYDDANVAPLGPNVATDADRKLLRREIMQWWQGLSERIEGLEANIANERTGSHLKALPRLPSDDDAYDHDNNGHTTPKGTHSPLPSQPPNTPHTPDAAAPDERYPFPKRSDTKESFKDSSSTQSSSSSSSTDANSLHLLAILRHNFQRTEQSLYKELARTPVSRLNDVRRSFLSAARGATKRLSAWETKHAAKPKDSPITSQLEPEWWKQGYHAVPGGNVVIREDDLGSIIAFTLSSIDYRRELSQMSTNRSATTPAEPPSTPASDRPSVFGSAVPSKWFTSSAPEPDPDQEDAVWHEPEPHSAVITRKEHPRDPTSLLTMSIPEVLRQKGAADTAGLPLTSRFHSTGAAGGKSPAQTAPPLAWAKPDVQISKEAADGHLSGAAGHAVDKIRQDLEAAAEPEKSPRSSISDSQFSSSSLVETNIRRGQASSLISADSDTETVTGDSREPSPPPPPPKSEPARVHDSHQTPSDKSLPSAESGAGSSLSNTLSAAFRYVMRGGEQTPPQAKYQHGLLSAPSPAIDDRPHIKYDWTIGKRLKFSCTVYYAKQFDALRRRCGIEEDFLRSLTRCSNWRAEGGKSKSNFWKTADDQFIIKTLVNAWNVADLQVLIDLGPSYFRHMDATANKPTVLAKLLGFYTIEVKNLESGTTQTKTDLLIMENLFYDQKVTKAFDLKGIQGRKVKAAASSTPASKILFDGEWMEGQQRALTLVRPYSKVVLQEAIRADCDFLARSNIMDYSLLLGIDEEQKQIACGLVDTIGSYTFAKTLEYKAKQGLKAGKEVTVIPPNEYRDRFVHAMDSYFLPCPDKWSRPPDDTKVPNDDQQLPSVL